jgi:hypothetical protein
MDRLGAVLLDHHKTTCNLPLDLFSKDLIETHCRVRCRSLTDFVKSLGSHQVTDVFDLIQFLNREDGVGRSG